MLRAELEGLEVDETARGVAFDDDDDVEPEDFLEDDDAPRLANPALPVVDRANASATGVVTFTDAPSPSRSRDPSTDANTNLDDFSCSALEISNPGRPRAAAVGGRDLGAPRAVAPQGLRAAPACRPRRGRGGERRRRRPPPRVSNERNRLPVLELFAAPPRRRLRADMIASLRPERAAPPEAGSTSGARSRTAARRIASRPRLDLARPGSVDEVSRSRLRRALSPRCSSPARAAPPRTRRRVDDPPSTDAGASLRSRRDGRRNVRTAGRSSGRNCTSRRARCAGAMKRPASDRRTDSRRRRVRRRSVAHGARARLGAH